MEYRFEVYRIMKVKNINTKKIVDGSVAYDTNGNFGDTEHFLVTVERQDEYKSLETFTTAETYYLTPHETTSEDKLTELVIGYIKIYGSKNINRKDVFTYAGCSLIFKDFVESLVGPCGKLKI